MFLSLARLVGGRRGWSGFGQVGLALAVEKGLNAEMGAAKWRATMQFLNLTPHDVRIFDAPGENILWTFHAKGAVVRIEGLERELRSMRTVLVIATRRLADPAEAVEAGRAIRDRIGLLLDGPSDPDRDRETQAEQVKP